MTNKNVSELKQLILQLNNDTTSYLTEMKDLVSTIKQQQKLSIVSYFTYSFSISHQNDQDSLLIGTYHIQNLGNKLLSNPYICIKLSQDSPFTFSGKYVNKKSNLSITPDTWERLNEQTDKHEYWLKPISKKVIEPSEILSFPNFQVKWLPKESYAGSIFGFTYCDEFQEGIHAVNQIYVNGS
ncbi:hypothetical protein ACFFHM_05690 [Halalkalibacter kiskunsagensis]|uniref:Pyridoxamine 5'-phosphate oxidase putative domain-containing protein n=1 Tax=Halalkalibacter kiskunsagensis TaxID=1548599 RepID=A0ABV6KAH5_9BACI